MNVRNLRRLVLASLVFGLVVGSPATRADPSKPRLDPCAEGVEAALGVDPDEAIRGLDRLAWACSGSEVAVSVAIAVLSRAHWTSDSRGVDVREKAIEVLGLHAMGATGVLGVLERVVEAEGVDERIQVAGKKALSSIRRLADPARREAIAEVDRQRADDDPLLHGRRLRAREVMAEVRRQALRALARRHEQGYRGRTRRNSGYCSAPATARAASRRPAGSRPTSRSRCRR